MATRRIYDTEQHAQFVTFSCAGRRKLLDHPRVRDEFVAITAEKLAEHKGLCSGFVVMPNHVHAILWFAEPGMLSPFMQTWKQTSSLRLKRLLRGVCPRYAAQFSAREAFWLPRYYPFNLFSDQKAEEKLNYMHRDPVTAGLAASPCDWNWSSARYFELGEDVGIPINWIF